MIRHLIDAAKGKHPLRKRRSPEWKRVRREHLAKHPGCAVCGGTKKVDVHHIQPFHLRPDLELDPTNLITLCERKRFFNHHRIFGHLNNWRLINPDVAHDAPRWRDKISEAKERRRERTT